MTTFYEQQYQVNNFQITAILQLYPFFLLLHHLKVFLSSYFQNLLYNPFDYFSCILIPLFFYSPW